VTFNAASVLRVSFQNVSATDGNPDGTQDQYRDMTTLSANSWTTPGLMTSDGTDGGVKRSVTKGDILAFVVEYQTFTAADSVQTSYILGSGITNAAGTFPYHSLFTASWVKNLSSYVLALKYDDGTYHFPSGCYPASALNTVTFNNTTNPDERGLLFQLPFPATLEGLYWRLDLDNDADLIIYDASDVAQRTFSLDKDIRSSSAGQWNNIIFSSPLDLAANTNYRAVIKPTSASNISTYDWDAGVSLNNFIGGSTWKHTTRNDGAGAWTDSATKRPWMGLILNGFDDGTGGGSSGPANLIGGGLVRI
jgi:hypothetical protein